MYFSMSVETDIKDYYDTMVLDEAAASGAGFIWYLGRDHLSPMYDNSDQFALDTSRWREGISRRILSMFQQMPIDAGDVVVDLGSGMGGPGRDMTEAMGANVLGVNLSMTQLRTALRLSKERESSYTTGINADIQYLPFRNESIDHAFSINMLYHVPEPCLVFRGLSRILKPGGQFALDDWFLTGKATPDTQRELRHNWSSPAGFHKYNDIKESLEVAGLTIGWEADFTEEAGAFLTEERFGAVYDEQLSSVLKDAFPRLWQYDTYVPDHAELAVKQLRDDVLRFGQYYRDGQASYRQLIAQKSA